jgi:hypothetical protein
MPAKAGNQSRFQKARFRPQLVYAKLTADFHENFLMLQNQVAEQERNGPSLAIFASSIATYQDFIAEFPELDRFYQDLKPGQRQDADRKTVASSCNNVGKSST